MSKPTVFLSYSHLDDDWKTRLEKHLRVLDDEIDVWSDRRIRAGDDWYPEIEAAMAQANAAVLMVTADLLTSKFIRTEEVPRLLDRRQRDGLLVVPIIVKPCPWTAVDWLSRMQVRPLGATPLSTMSEAKADEAMTEIVLEIYGRLAEQRKEAPPEPEAIGNLKPGGVLLKQWKIIRELGRGGFGTVLEAEDLLLGRQLAIKVLDPAMAAQEELLARFRREVAVMRELAHPRVVRVFDYREDDTGDQPIALITMEQVAGCSVRRLINSSRESGTPVPVPLATRIFEQVLEALEAAHAAGVIHRDVTPGNILLAGGSADQLLQDPGRDPQVKLADFGIAGLAGRAEQSHKSRLRRAGRAVAQEPAPGHRSIRGAGGPRPGWRGDISRRHLRRRRRDLPAAMRQAADGHRPPADRAPPRRSPGQVGGGDN
jgi:hypothetical protein